MFAILSNDSLVIREKQSFHKPSFRTFKLKDLSFTICSFCFKIVANLGPGPEW